jgi:hypothetical protein
MPQRQPQRRASEGSRAARSSQLSSLSWGNIIDGASEDEVAPEDSASNVASSATPSTSDGGPQWGCQPIHTLAGPMLEWSTVAEMPGKAKIRLKKPCLFCGHEYAGVPTTSASTSTRRGSRAMWPPAARS